MGGYTTKQVSELIGINSDAVRHYVRRSLLVPEKGVRGEYRFSFQDVVLLRTAKGLIDARVSIRKIYRSLLKLKDDLKHVDSLSSLRILFKSSNLPPIGFSIVCVFDLVTIIDEFSMSLFLRSF